MSRCGPKHSKHTRSNDNVLFGPQKRFMPLADVDFLEVIGAVSSYAKGPVACS
jgi:hypothetical protein